MNYIKEMNAFRDWVLINKLSTGQIALWYSLMSVNNMTGWIEWFTAPNQTLQLMSGLSRQGLDKARVQLGQRGRIEYKKGKSNNAGHYKIIPFIEVECKKVGTEVDTIVGTEGAHKESQKGRKSSTLLNINKTKQNIKDKPLISPKVKFGDFVSMKNEELEKLVSKYGTEFTERCIEVLDNYKGSSGKTYKSDYHTILKWVVTRVNEEKGSHSKQNIRSNGRSGKPFIPVIDPPPEAPLTAEELEEMQQIVRKLS